MLFTVIRVQFFYSKFYLNLKNTIFLNLILKGLGKKIGFNFFNFMYVLCVIMGVSIFMFYYKKNKLFKINYKITWHNQVQSNNVTLNKISDIIFIIILAVH